MTKTLLSLVTAMVIGTTTMFASTVNNPKANNNHGKCPKMEVKVNKHGNNKYDLYEHCNCRTCKDLMHKMEQEKKQKQQKQTHFNNKNQKNNAKPTKNQHANNPIKGGGRR